MTKRAAPNATAHPSWEQTIPNSLVLRLVLVAIGLAAALYAVQVLWDLLSVVFDIIVVVFFAWILATAIRRLRQRIKERLATPYQWAAMPAAFLLLLLPLIALLSIWVPYSLSQAVALSDDLPEYAAILSERLALLEELGRSLGITPSVPGQEETLISRVTATVSEWVQANALSIVQSTTGILFNIFLVLALTIYLVIEGDRIGDALFQITPQRHHDVLRAVTRQMHTTFFSYLRGVLAVAVIYSVWITAVMFAAGLPFSLLLGTVSGFVQIIPIIGEVGALGIPITVAFLTKPLSTALIVSGVLIGFSLLANNLILPRILGEATKMPGFFVLLAVIVGSQIFGPLGAILGVPVVAFVYSLALAWASRGSFRAAVQEGQPEESNERRRSEA